MVKALVSLSGGIDSATALAECIEKNGRRAITAVGFYYGSKHNKYENQAADQLARWYNVPYKQIDLSGIMVEFKSSLLLGGNTIPEGHYEEESMRQTVVPFRNGIFCSVLAGLAGSLEANEIWLGVHAGDHFIYPDCRPGFLSAMQQAVQRGLDLASLKLIAPFVGMTKTEIVKRGVTLGVPYMLCRTCYQDQPTACGRCGSCQERIEAFVLNQQIDPIPYQSRELFPKGK